MDMDTRFDRRVLALAARRSGGVPRGRAMAVAGVAVGAVILGLLVLVLDGHGISWLAGLVAGATTAAWAAVVRARTPVAGTAAARRTEMGIAPLEQAGWRFLHGVPGPGGIYDHVAVGPGGLILLESMSPAGVVRMKDGEPVVERAAAPGAPVRLERLRPTALTHATTLRESMWRIAGRRLWVQAVVVFWSDFPAGCVVDGRCAYIHGSRLAEWLSRRPHQLDENEAEAVYDAVREVAEDAERGLPLAV
jgi:hypothetical protein